MNRTATRPRPNDTISGAEQHETTAWLEALPRTSVVRDGRGTVWEKGPNVVPSAPDVWRGTNGHAWHSPVLVERRAHTGHDTFTVLWVPAGESVGSPVVALTQPSASPQGLSRGIHPAH